MKIAFLNDTSAWYHWGCTGTSEAIKAELVVRGHDVTAVGIQHFYACQMMPQSSNDFDNPQFFNQFFKANTALAAPILQNDAVIINGEGCLHRLTKLSLTILYVAYAAKKYAKKNVQIINHSCYPDGDGAVPDSPAFITYRGVYRILDYVAIREHRSRDVMKTLGIDAALAFDCLPLYIKNHPSPAPKRERSIVIAGSVAWKQEGIKALASYIAAMEKKGFTVRVLTGARANPAQDDLKFIEALRAAAPSGWMHVDAPSMPVWLDTIRQASLMISGRFHYTIAACMLDTPCIVLDSNTPKNLALTESANLAPPLSFATEKLDDVLMRRGDELLGTVPLDEAAKAQWVERAQKNFVGV